MNFYDWAFYYLHFMSFLVSNHFIILFLYQTILSYFFINCIFLGSWP